MEQEPRAARLMRLINGDQLSQAIHVAVVLGIPDLLGHGSKSAAELAPAAGAHGSRGLPIERRHPDDRRRLQHRPRHAGVTEITPAAQRGAGILCG